MSTSDISTEIEDIQSELTQRIELVEELKREAEIAENVISLSDNQVNAIQAKLKQELDSNNGKSLLQDILINTLFFILGIISPKVFKLRKNKDDSNAASFANSYSEEQIAQAIQLLDNINKNKK